MELHDALYRGSARKIINAVKAGTPLHPELPNNLTSERGARLSPISMIWRWDWEAKEKLCLEALGALLEGGADPNMPCDSGRTGLVMALYVQERRFPVEAVNMLLEAGADPAVPSSVGAQRTQRNALGQCMLANLPDHAVTILQKHPGAAVMDVGDGLGKPLEVLVNNAMGWTKEEGVEMIKALIHHGANIDSKKIKTGGVAPWVSLARTQMDQESLDEILPEAQAPGRAGPRL